MKKIIALYVILLTCVGAKAQENLQPLQKIYQQFTFTLFDKIVEDSANNIILSPLSAQIALSMLQNGASGNTLAQIQEVMGTAGYTDEEVNEYNHQLMEQLSYRPPFEDDPQEKPGEWERYEAAYPTCEMANGVWTLPSIPLLNSFKDLLGTHYDAEAGNVDFGTQEGVDSINGWVSRHTHHLIPSVLDEPDPDILFLLANTLYFKGCWTMPFDSLKTHTAPFHLADGTTTEVDMMQGNIICHVVHSGNYICIRIPYGKEDFSMTVFLPKDAGSVSPPTLFNWAEAMYVKTGSTHVNLQMPKFEIGGHYEMEDILQSMGMEDAFSASADFSRLSDVGMWISKVFQNSKISVDEKGTEAAAVTVIEGKRDDSSSWSLTVDRPFYFTIQHRPTGTILFIGRMTEIGTAAQVPDGILLHQATVTDHQPLYDLSGRVLQNAPEKSVYIQNGKKRVR